MNKSLHLYSFLIARGETSRALYTVMQPFQHISRIRSSSFASFSSLPTLVGTHGRSSPTYTYRRISSLSLHDAHPASLVSRPQFPSSRQPLLRSSLLPKSIDCGSSPSPLSLSSRSFHTSPRWSQQAQQAKRPEAESNPNPKPEDGSEEAKESYEKKNTKDGEEKEEEEGKQEKKEKAPPPPPPPPPPHGEKTPWQVFMETMQAEFKSSKEWNEGTKAIADSAHQFKESEQVRMAREAYEKTSGAVTGTASTVLKTTATAVGKGAQWTWETPVIKGVRKGANVTGEALDKATKPIRDTEAFKSVKETIDDGSSSRYGGWADKEERRKRRERRDQKLGINREPLEEDPEAGTNVTLHKDAAWKEAWRDFRDQNKVVQSVFGLRAVYQESENPLISTARGITDSIAGFFSENETAEVIKKFRAMDPNFKLEPFLEELREYILPEVLDAYVQGDTETLKQWLSAAQYSVYEALTKQYLQAGLRSDGRILDIRHVDIVRARMLEPGDIPVFIITCRTQEVHVYRKAKTGELSAGMEDRVQQVTYAIGITRTPEDVNNPETRGWRLIEMQKTGRNYY